MIRFMHEICHDILFRLQNIFLDSKIVLQTIRWLHLSFVYRLLQRQIHLGSGKIFSYTKFYELQKLQIGNVYEYGYYHINGIFFFDLVSCSKILEKRYRQTTCCHQLTIEQGLIKYLN